MRHALALALLFALGCSSAVDPPTRCTPGASVACVCPGVGIGAQVCEASGASYGVCVCGTDAGVDASAEDRPALDAVTEDRPDVVGPDLCVCPDVPPQEDVVDAGGVDVVDAPPRPDVVDGGICPNGRTAVCDGREVSLVNGVVDGGRNYHCGACGRTCPLGEFCVSCACGR